jgi:hypothetical protein
MTTPAGIPTMKSGRATDNTTKVDEKKKSPKDKKKNKPSVIKTSALKEPSQSSSFKDTDEILMYLQEPKKVPFGPFKVFLTIVCGVYFGAFLAKSVATLFAEYDIYVMKKDDSDD